MHLVGVIKTFGVDEVALSFFSNSALNGGDLSGSYPFRFVSGDSAPKTQRIGAMVGPRVGVGFWEKRRSVDIEVQSQSICLVHHL